MNKNQILAFTLLGLFFIAPYLKSIQADNTNNVEILNPQVQPATIKVGDTFAINATLVNNSTNTINVHNGCGGPFSVIFDNHATVDVKKVCNWMAVQIILKPGENITATSLASNLAYRATAHGAANATVTFSYIIGNQTDPNLSFDNNATSISKSFLFTISNETAQTSSMTISPLKQFKSGFAAKDVKCEHDLQLVIKAEDGSPACIKPNDATMLVQRGWATPF
ncbi:MAG: hypothetical protein E6L05_00580 [Thaumarchaeota archaeon]|nr:MAG: hypothetical protein E6L05_00580 [Nitrososphaerota archaeon]